MTYRPPDCPVTCFQDQLKPNYMQALLLAKSIIILGDLNCNTMKNSPERKALIDISSELNLIQVINAPTRITPTCQSLIDVILVTSRDLVRDSGVLPIPISDHLPVFIVVKLKITKAPPCYITVRSYKNYVPSLFTADLASNSDRLLTIFSEDDVNAKLRTFNDVLQSTLDAHAPVRTIKIRSRPCPYVTLEMKELMRSKDRLHGRFQQTRDSADWNNYKEARNNIKTTLKRAEQEYVRSEVQTHKDNPGSLWKIINSSIPSKEKQVHVYSKEPKQVADEFNAFFSSVGRRAAEAAASLAVDNDSDMTLPCHTFPSCRTPVLVEVFNFRPVTCTDVQRIIQNMPSNKSPGPDKISMRVIKDCLPVILGPLTDIVNCSLTTSMFPNEWKEAEVIPLLKEGDHEMASNNRPLSLLVVASKVCERIALEQFSSYLLRNDHLTCHQSGNKKHYSTETLNLLVTDHILEAMDKKQLTALVLLDLSKAFDSISHAILLRKLSAVGASARAVGWFHSYLSGRSQRVRIGSTVSSPLIITHGVPQGAILSPLLFCIYLNDLPSAPRVSHLESYVDDSKVFMSFPIKDIVTAKKSIEDDLHRVATWCSQNQLLINPDKTKFLLVGTRQLLQRLDSDMTLSFLGKEIKRSLAAKDLGVIIDTHLSYDAHVSSTVSSCMAKLGQINRVRKCFPSDTLQLIISALVLSKLFYCSTVWSNTSANNIRKLQALQNFACRIITDTKKYEHITPALKQLGWLPVKEELLYRESVMTYKCVNGMAPQYLCNKLINRSHVHDRNTRNRALLQIPLHRTTSGQRSFRYRAVTIWNNLESSLKQVISIHSFKKNMKKQMFNEFLVS